MAYYWCLDHGQVEQDDTDCPPDRRLGPYPTQEDARNWKESVSAKTEEWEREEEEDA